MAQQKLLSTKDIELVTNRIGRQYWIWKDDKLYKQRIGQQNGPYQTRNLQMLRRCCPNARTVIDVGSNLGTNTIEYATWAKTVESFEPMRNSLKLCKMNVNIAKKAQLKGKYFNRKKWTFEHDPNKDDGWFKLEDGRFASLDLIGKINFYNIALGNTAGQIKMEQRLSEYSRGDCIMVNGKSKHPTQSVKMQTIDSYNFTDVDIIKIDVEGSELMVLQGAEKTIKKYKPIIQCELRDSHTRRYGYRPLDLIKFMRSFKNYTVCDFNGKKIQGDKLPNAVMDVFFVPNIIYKKLKVTNKVHPGMIQKTKNIFEKLFNDVTL